MCSAFKALLDGIWLQNGNTAEEGSEEECHEYVELVNHRYARKKSIHYDIFSLHVVHLNHKIL